MDNPLIRKKKETGFGIGSGKMGRCKMALEGTPVLVLEKKHDYNDPMRLT